MTSLGSSVTYSHLFQAAASVMYCHLFQAAARFPPNTRSVFHNSQDKTLLHTHNTQTNLSVSTDTALTADRSLESSLLTAIPNSGQLHVVVERTVKQVTSSLPSLDRPSISLSTSLSRSNSKHLLNMGWIHGVTV